MVITYNHVAFVRDAISSILDQDFSGEWEIIVADDCSMDGTLAVLRDFEDENTRLRVVTGPHNVGAQRNLRRALRSAKGQYVAFLEGDDYWTDASKLSRQVAFLEFNSDLAAVGHVTTVRNSRFGDTHTVTRDDLTDEPLRLSDILRGQRLHLSSLMFRKSLLPDTPSWFDDLIAADFPILCLLAQQGDIGVIPRQMSEYRVNEDSVWSFLPSAEKGLDILKRAAALRRNAGLSRVALKDTTRSGYARLFGGLVGAGVSRGTVRIAVNAFAVDPPAFFPQLVAWSARQAKERLGRTD